VTPPTQQSPVTDPENAERPRAMKRTGVHSIVLQAGGALDDLHLEGFVALATLPDLELHCLAFFE
jgi:hypothetical protein